MKKFRGVLFQLFKIEHAQSVTMDKVQAHFEKEVTDDIFSADEIYSAIEGMMDANQVMLSDNVVFLI